MKKNVQEIGHVSKLTLGFAVGNMIEYFKPNGQPTFRYQAPPVPPKWPKDEGCNLL